MSMTIVDLHPLTDRLMALVAKGEWSEAHKQAEQIRILAVQISRHCEKLAEAQ